MSAAGEDVLAWTKAAIARVEEAARHATQGTWRSHDTHLDHGGHTATILAGEGNDTELLAWLPTMSHQPWDEARNAWRNADHITQHAPESVLRRCAAERKLLAAYQRCIGPQMLTTDDPRLEGHREGRSAALLEAVRAIAEGYGWTRATTDSPRGTDAGRTPPTDGDQMT